MKGVSNVISAAILITIFLSMFLVSSLYLNSKIYELKETGSSIISEIKRNSEELKVIDLGNKIKIENIGPEEVSIKGIILEDPSTGKVELMNITKKIGIGKWFEYPVPDKSYNIYVLTSSGRIYTPVAENSKSNYVSKDLYLNNSGITVNNVNSKIDAENIPRSILYISMGDGSYYEIDYDNVSLIYEGRYRIYTSVDKEIILTRYSVFNLLKRIYHSNLYLAPIYIGFDYIVFTDGQNAYLAHKFSCENIGSISMIGSSGGYVYFIKDR